MNQKLIPKLSKYALLILACAVLSGVWLLPAKRGGSSVSTTEVKTSGNANPTLRTTATGELSALPTSNAAGTNGEVLPPAPTPDPDALKAISATAGDGWYAEAVENIKKSEYQIRYFAEQGAHYSANRAQDLRFRYEADGYTATQRTDGQAWNFGLNVERVGALQPVTNPRYEATANHLLVSHPGFTIEYLNSEEGMRQNFIVSNRPAGDRLDVRLGVSGTLKATQPAANQIAFRNAKNEIKAFYQDLKAWDATGKALPSSMKLDGGDVVLAVNTVGAQFPVTVDPITNTPGWTNSTTQNVFSGESIFKRDAQLGYSVAIIGSRTGSDVHKSLNNDGAVDYQDILVGAPFFDNGAQDRCGAIFAYYGTSNGPSTNFGWSRVSTQGGSYFGYAVACAGNVYRRNGAELFAEIIVGAPLWDDLNLNANSGRVFMYAGSSTGLPAPANTFVGGDNNPGVDTWETSELANLTTPGISNGLQSYPQAQLGFSVSGAGNCGGTTVGRADIIVGAPSFGGTYGNGASSRAYNFRSGMAVIYFGAGNNAWPATNNNVFQVTINQVAAGTAEQELGFSVGTVGSDMDGDGLDEVLVGCPGYETNAAQTNEGSAYLIRTTGCSEELISTLAAGVGAIVPNRRLFIDVFGVAAGENAPISYEVVESNVAGARLGFSLAGDGDVNNDGKRDVLVGAPEWESTASQTDEGAVWLFIGDNNVAPGDGLTFFASHQAAHGIITDILTPAETQLQSNQAGARFGHSVSFASSLNGPGIDGAGNITTRAGEDKFDEIVIGAPFMEGMNTYNPINEGVVFIYYYDATQLANESNADVDPLHWCMLEGDRRNSLFGSSVSGTKLPSFPADGASANGNLTLNASTNEWGDILVGIPGYDATEGVETDEGRARAFFGRRGIPAAAFVSAPYIFCPGQSPSVTFTVSNLMQNDTFRVSFFEGPNMMTSQLYTYTRSDFGAQTFTLTTTPQAGSTVYQITQLKLNGCCWFTLNLSANATAQAPDITAITVTNVLPICSGTAVTFGNVTVSNINISDVVTVTWTANGVAQTPIVRTAAAVTLVLTNADFTPTQTPTVTTTYCITSVTRTNATGTCSTTYTSNCATATVITAPTVTVNNIATFCPGSSPTVTFSVTGIATNVCWRMEYRVVRVSDNVVLNGPTWTGPAGAANGQGNVTNVALTLPQVYNTDVRIDILNFAVRKVASGVGACPANGAGVAAGNPGANYTGVNGCVFAQTVMKTANLRSNTPRVQFVVDTTYFCRNTMPQVRVLITNVDSNEVWTIGWSENDPNVFNANLLVSTGRGPGYFYISDISTTNNSMYPARYPALSTAIGPNVQTMNAKYYLSYIIAGTCTTDYPPNVDVLEAVVANTTMPGIVFDPTPNYCPGQTPLVKFNAIAVPATETFSLSGYYVNQRTGQIQTFSTIRYTGQGPHTLDRIVVGVDTILLSTIHAGNGVNDRYEYHFFLYQNVVEPLCPVMLSNVSTGFAPSNLGTVSINDIPSFCPGTAPNATINVPPGSWSVTYRETYVLNGVVTEVDRTININAPISGAYAINTSMLNSNATYRLLSAVKTGGGNCTAMLGPDKTAFLSANAGPQVTFNSPINFCTNSVPQITINVQNVPQVAGALVPGTTAFAGQWSVGFREGTMTAPLQFTNWMTGPMANVLLRNMANTIPTTQNGNTTYYIESIYVAAGCTTTYSPFRSVTATALVRPNVQFQSATQLVCAGTQPSIIIQVENIAVGQSYTVNWMEGATARSMTGVVTTIPYFVQLSPVGTISANTVFQLTSVTNNNNTCTSVPSGLITTNLQVNNTAVPNVVWSAASFTFCPNTAPILGVTVTNVNANDSWTIAYQDDATGVRQTVNGVGNPVNFTFPTTFIPSGNTTYRILSITNNTTGCSQTFNNVTAAANQSNFAGSVTLTPVDNVCNGNLPVFTVNVPGVGANQPWTLYWSENGNFRITGGIGPVFTLPLGISYSTPGQYMVELFFIVTGQACAPAVDATPRTFMVLSGGAAATFNVNNPATVCSGTVPTVNVNITPAGSYTLTYRVNAGATQTVSGVGSMVNIGGAAALVSATSYTIVSIISGSCVTTYPNNSVTVNVTNAPNAAWSGGPFTFCPNTTPTLSIDVTGVTNPNDQWTVYYRQVGAAQVQTVTGTNNRVNFTFTPTIMPTGTVQYEIITVVNNTTGCTRTLTGVATTATQTVTGGTVDMALSAALVCPGAPPVATVTVPVGAGVTYTLTWSENGNARSTVGSGPTLILPLSLSYATAGTYSLQLLTIQVAGGGCQPTVNNSVRTFTVQDAPNASFAAGNATSICAGVTPTVNVNISPALTSGTLSYTVNGTPMSMQITSGTVNIGGGVPVFTTQTYVLTSVSNGTCSRSLSGTVPAFVLTVNPQLLPAVASSTSPAGCVNNGTITVNGNLGQAGLRYTLTNQGTGAVSGPFTSATGTFTFSGLTAGTYTAMVMDANNCSASVTNFNLLGTGNTTPTIVSGSVMNSFATITFTSVQGGSPYTVRFRQLPNGNPLQVLVNDQTFPGNVTTQIGPLTAGASYEFSVSSSCNPGVFSQTFIVATQGPCATNPVLAIPTGVAVTTQQVGTFAKVATVRWNRVSDATGYVVAWRVVGGNPVFSTSTLCDGAIPNDPNNAALKMYTIPGSFLLGVTYEVKVRSQCLQCGINPDAVGSSMYTNTVSFRIDEETAATTRFSVYPNPNNGAFTVSFDALEANNVSVELLDMTGRVIFNKSFQATVGSNDLPVELEGFAKGVYMLQLRQSDAVRTTKVVLQ